MSTYPPERPALLRGKGLSVWDDEGREYLDMFAGIAVSSLGHAHEAVVRAVSEQVATIAHASNLFVTEPAVRLAERLLEATGMHRVFFANSGAEANEAAIKIARKWGSARGGRYEILTCFHGFHGRTIATLTATAQPKYQEGFGPLLEGFKYVAYGSIDAVLGAIGPKTAAVLVEPIQGEGGVTAPPDGFLRALRELCDEHDLLLMLDEIQSGLGRTGWLYAYMAEGVRPDVFTTAKGLGAGIPIGACLVNERADVFVPGDHGSTFGGNPVACAAANAVLDVVNTDEFLAGVREVAGYLDERLDGLAAGSAKVKELRGRGLLRGIALHEPAAPIVAATRERGVIIGSAGPDTLRIAPPLICRKEHVDRLVDALGPSLVAD